MVHFALRCPAASPLGHAPKVRPVWSGLAMCLDISVEPCQNPSRSVWEAFGTAFMMRSGLIVRAASFFSGPPRCVAVRIAAKTPSTCICTRSSRRLRSRAAASWRRDRRWPQRGCGPAARAPRCSPARPASVGCAGWTIAGIVFCAQRPLLCGMDKSSY